jgi:hypothetical protein
MLHAHGRCPDHLFPSEWIICGYWCNYLFLLATKREVHVLPPVQNAPSGLRNIQNKAIEYT